MKKKLFQLCIALAMLGITNEAFSQSVLIVENPESKPVPVKNTNTEAQPVPVKLMNPTPTGQTKIPFMEQSLEGGGITKLLIKSDPGETKVIEYLLATGISAYTIELSNTKGKYQICLPTASNNCSNNTYSGAINIVIKNGETFTFQIGGSSNRSILVSGYTIKEERTGTVLQ